MPSHKLAVFSSATVFQSPHSVTSSLCAIRQQTTCVLSSLLHFMHLAGGHTHACMRDPNIYEKTRGDKKWHKLQKGKNAENENGAWEWSGDGMRMWICGAAISDRKMRDNWSVNWWVGNNNWCHFKLAKWSGLKESAQGYTTPAGTTTGSTAAGCGRGYCWWYPNLRWYFTSTFRRSAAQKRNRRQLSDRPNLQTCELIHCAKCSVNLPKISIASLNQTFFKIQQIVLGVVLFCIIITLDRFWVNLKFTKLCSFVCCVATIFLHCVFGIITATIN